jgi:hypothetical protein
MIHIVITFIKSLLKILDYQVVCLTTNVLAAPYPTDKAS